MKYKQPLLCCLLLAISSLSRNTAAEQATIAVAANFTAPMKAIVAQFEKTSPHQIRLSFGSSGKFFAQIRQGAPYDVLFSADQEKPNALIMQKMAVGDSCFTYALGKLVLWSADKQLLLSGSKALLNGNFKKLALANPRLAPYGLAAQQVLEHLSLKPAVSGKLVLGENIAQTFQFIHSGNAELGFVAVSQLAALQADKRGSSWEIPANLYTPIRQDAVLLTRASNNAAARALIEFTKTPAARTLIENYGYSLPPIQ